MGYGDNESKLIKAVDNLERRKDEPTQLGLFDDEEEEESDDYEYDDDDTSSDDQNYPPRNHTGSFLH